MSAETFRFGLDFGGGGSLLGLTLVTLVIAARIAARGIPVAEADAFDERCESELGAPPEEPPAPRARVRQGSTRLGEAGLQGKHARRE